MGFIKQMIVYLIQEKFSMTDFPKPPYPDKNCFFSQISNTRWIVLDLLRGCYIHITIKTEEGERYDYDWCYRWIHFQVLQKYQLQLGAKGEKLWHYDAIIEDTPLFNVNFDELKDEIAKHASQGNGKDRITVVLKQYVMSNLVPEIEMETVCGFTKNGWRFPPSYRFVAPDAMIGEIHHNLEIAMQQVVDLDLPNKLRILWEETTFQYKDIAFAYGCIAPFMYALLDHVNLRIFLALGGRKERGKTKFCEMISNKWWGHIFRVFGASALKTNSRSESLLASSTLPIIFDDCEHLQETLEDIFRTMGTNHDSYIRKRPDQSYRINSPYVAMPLLNFNQSPRLMENSAFRDRLVFLQIQDSPIENNWSQIFEDLPNGAIGRYVVEITKDWTLDSVQKKYDAINITQYKGRVKKIMRYFTLGQQLAKEWFNLDLDLTLLPDIIKDTKEYGNDELLDQIVYQCIKGISRIEYKQEQDKITGKLVIKEQIIPFYPLNWIHYPIYTDCNYKGLIGYALDSNALSDLNNQWCGKGSQNRAFTFESLSMRLQDSWPLISNPNLTICVAEGKRKTRCVFIPKIYIEQYFTETDYAVRTGIDSYSVQTHLECEHESE